MTARPLFKLSNTMTDQQRIHSLQRRLAEEQQRRRTLETQLAAERQNTHRFHALLIAERIRHVTPHREA